MGEPVPGQPRLGAFGIAVDDLERSADFYRSVFGMVDAMTFDLPHMREIVLGFPDDRGSGLVLMQYTDGSDHRRSGDPLKLVLYVADPEAVAASVSEQGGTVVMAPRRFPKMGDVMVGFAKDPDGHLIELLEA